MKVLAASVIPTQYLVCP